MTMPCKLIYAKSLQAAHAVIVALRESWQQLIQYKATPTPELLQRYQQLIQQLQQLPLPADIKPVLKQLQQQLQNHHTDVKLMPLQQALAHFGIQLNHQTDSPWFHYDPGQPLPVVLQGLGKAWRQQLKKYKDHPTKRLQLAWQNLPYSAAFHEACLALRAILREKNTSDSPALPLLYYIAAFHSFIRIEPETPRGDLIAAAFSGKSLLQQPICYQQLGTQALALLNQTDQQRIQKQWGLPAQHQRLADLLPDLHQQYLTAVQPS